MQPWLQQPDIGALVNALELRIASSVPDRSLPEIPVGPLVKLEQRPAIKQRDSLALASLPTCGKASFQSHVRAGHDLRIDLEQSQVIACARDRWQRGLRAVPRSARVGCAARLQVGRTWTGKWKALRQPQPKGTFNWYMAGDLRAGRGS